jgi:hypothetical protein
MLTDEQQFKVAFLGALADQGIGPTAAHTLVQQALAQLEKQAEGEEAAALLPKVTDITSRIPLYDAVSRGLGSLLAAAPTAALAANFAIPGGLGAAGGYALAKLQETDGDNPAELRTRETIENYRRLAAEMSVQRQLRDNRAGHSRALRPLVR